MTNYLKGLCLVAALFVSFGSDAQQMQPRSPKDRAERQAGWMNKNLALTEEQNKEVYDILLKYATQADETRSAARGPEKRAERQGIQKDREADLKAVLTGEQFQKYQAHEQEMKEKMIERRQMRMEGN